MTLYELLHSIPPQVLLSCIKEVNSLNDVVSKLEEYYLPFVLDVEPENPDEGKCLYVLRDEHYRPIVAFDTSLEATISLRNILAREVRACVSLKHLPPEKIAAYCYCSLPVSLVVEVDGKCKVSRAFDPVTSTLLSKVTEYVLPY